MTSPGGLSWGGALWLAARGGRTDGVRIGLTTVGTAVGTVAVLAAATVVAIPADAAYTSEVLTQSGLRPGVAFALVLLCIPVLAVVGQCARIGAPARDRRLAAIRMAGGAPADTARIAAAEAGIAATVGTLLGLVGFLIVRVVLDDPRPGTFLRTTEQRTDGGLTTYTEEVRGLVRPLPTDVLPPVWVLVLIVVAVPLGTVGLTVLALRRVAISPFGVVRRRTTRPARVLPAVLFGVGVAGLAGFSGLLRVLDLPPSATTSVVLAFLGLFLLTSAGLIGGSAALAAAVGRFVAGRTGSPVLLMAARRLIADPYAASRAYGALLLTVLLGAGAQGVRMYILTATEPSETFYRDTLDLVDLVIVVAVAIAALGLLVVAAEDVVSRRRSMAALTAAGTPVRVLRGTVLAQALLPLLATVPLAAVAGMLAARGLFGATFRREMYSAANPDQPLVQLLPVPVPWAEVGVLVGGTLLVALALSALSLVLLRSSCDPAELRTAA